MDHAKIKQGKTYGYKTHNTEGRLKVGEVYQTVKSENGGGNSWFVIGFDKVKGRDVTVRPSQITA